MISLNPDEMFIQRIQRDLLLQSVAGWQRRGKNLLEINCGDGRFLKNLWHMGFDVSGVESSSKLRTWASNSLKDRAEIFAGEDFDLPFEDSYFDWAVLNVKSNDLKRLAQAMSEAIRVAELGLAVTFWNKNSPVLRFNSKGKIKNQEVSWWSIWNQLRKLHGGTLTTRSTLICAFAPFRHLCPHLYFKSWKSRFPLGAWTVIRLDLSPRHTVTPLFLRTNLRKINNLEPVLEYHEPLNLNSLKK